VVYLSFGVGEGFFGLNRSAKSGVEWMSEALGFAAFCRLDAEYVTWTEHIAGEDDELLVGEKRTLGSRR